MVRVYEFEVAVYELLHAATDVLALLLQMTGLSAQQVLSFLGLIVLYPFLVGLYVLRDSPNVRVVWSRLRPFPLGDWLFYRILRNSSPHSTTVPFEVLDLSSKGVMLHLSNHSSTHNVFKTVSYGAIVSMAEFAAVVQLMSQVDRNVRVVPTGARLDQQGRLHGSLYVFCQHSIATSASPTTEQVPVTIMNGQKEAVAKVVVSFSISRTN